jgi:predicted transposase/invertase (TIGR01784 family)
MSKKSVNTPPKVARASGKPSAAAKRDDGAEVAAKRKVGKRDAIEPSGFWGFGESPLRYIDPCTDFGFKHLFGREATKDVLIAFLNSILPEPYHIKTLRFLNKEHQGTNPKAKTLVYDIFCENAAKERFIVEMQQGDAEDFADRSVSYVARAISEQLPRGAATYKTLKTVFFIGILDTPCEIGGLLPRAFQSVQFKNDENGEFTGKMRLYFLRLSFFTKPLEELKTDTDKWFYFLKHLPDFSKIPAIFNAKVFRKAFHEAELAAMPAAQRHEYFQSLDRKIVWRSVMNTARKKASRKGLPSPRQSSPNPRQSVSNPRQSVSNPRQRQLRTNSPLPNG